MHNFKVIEVRPNRTGYKVGEYLARRSEFLTPNLAKDDARVSIRRIYSEDPVKDYLLRHPDTLRPRLQESGSYLEEF